MSLRIAALVGLSCVAVAAQAQSQYRLFAESYACLLYTSPSPRD